MAWADELVPLVRAMVDDQDATQYSTASLTKVIVAAARFVEMEMDFLNTYTVSMADQTISPDPVSAGDESFINLVALKASCIVERGEAVRAARQGISGQDGGARFDLRTRAETKVKLLDKNWCKSYEEAKLEYLSGQSRVAGAAVLSPYRDQPYNAGDLFN